VLDIGSEVVWERKALGTIKAQQWVLIQVDGSLAKGYACQMEVEKNVPESQEGFLQELGTPKEFLSLLHGLATVFVSRPVLFLAVFAAVENIVRIARLVLGRVLAARAFS
jgi:hypothetical protein